MSEYITLLHLFLSDSGRILDSNWNFWNSRTFHLHIFFYIIHNSDWTLDQFYTWIPWNLPGLIFTWNKWSHQTPGNVQTRLTRMLIVLPTKNIACNKNRTLDLCTTDTKACLATQPPEHYFLCVFNNVITNQGAFTSNIML